MRTSKEEEKNHDITSWGSLKKLKQMTSNLLNSQTNMSVIDKKQRRLKNLSQSINPSSSQNESCEYTHNYQTENVPESNLLSLTQTLTLKDDNKQKIFSAEISNKNEDNLDNESIDSANKFNIDKNIDFDQFRLQLETMKQLYEKKLIEIDNLNNDIYNKEMKINEYTQYLKKYMDQNKIKMEENLNGTNIYKSTLNNNNNTLRSINNEIPFYHNAESIMNRSSNLSQDEEKNLKLKEINTLKQEINNLKRKHEKQKAELEKQLNDELENSLKQLQSEYDNKIKEFTDENENIIKQLQDQILNLKLKLEDFDKKYITKAEHERIYNKIKEEQNKELEIYEKEVEKLEQLLRENNLLFVNNSNLNLTQHINPSNAINVVDMQQELNIGGENNEVVCMISNIDSPCNINEKKLYEINTQKSNKYSSKEINTKNSSIKTENVIYI